MAADSRADLERYATGSRPGGQARQRAVIEAFDDAVLWPAADWCHASINASRAASCSGVSGGGCFGQLDRASLRHCRPHLVLPEAILMQLSDFVVPSGCRRDMQPCPRSRLEGRPLFASTKRARLYGVRR